MVRFLEWMLESSLLVLIIYGVRKMFSGRVPYAMIYALWFLVLLRFLVPVNFLSTPVSVANIVSHHFFVKEMADGKADKRDGIVQEKEQQRNQEQDMTYGQGFSFGELSEHENVAGAAKSGAAGSGGWKDTDGNRKTELSHAGLAAGIGWSRFFGAIWIAGSVSLFLLMMISNARLLWKVKRNRVLYGQRKGVGIYMVSGIKSPCLYGFIRPAIYLPSCLLSSGRVDEEDVKQMITHEYVHYRHGDHIWAMLRMVLVSVYWFHPFLWMAASCSKKDAELFCDESTIRLIGEEKRLCYGDMLVRLAGERAWGDFFYSMMPMSRKGREMATRIRAISRKKSYAKWILVPMCAILIAAAGLTCSTGIGPLAREKGNTADAEGEHAVSGSAVRVVSDQEADSRIFIKMDLPGLGKSVRAMYRTEYVGQQSGIEEPSPEYAKTPGEAFEKYIHVFTNAVNTGDIGKMHEVIAEGSVMYEQQNNLVKNYFKRGIREEVKKVSISSVKSIDSSHAEIRSKEKIKVFYADGTAKIIKQKYRYTCEQYTVGLMSQEHPAWRLTDMKAV